MIAQSESELENAVSRNGVDGQADHPRTIRLHTPPASVSDAKPEPEESRIIRGPLAHDSWLAFNEQKFGLRPERVQYKIGNNEEAMLEAVLYLDKSGRVCHPMRNPYLPVSFVSTRTSQAHKISNQWIELASQLADDMRGRGVLNTIGFSPNVSDIRPWQWKRFRAGVKYTCMIDVPYDESGASQDVRRKFRKCAKAGFRVERTTDIEQAALCLAATEERQGYRLGISASDLILARRLLGDEAFRIYAVYAPNGEMATASIVLHQPGSQAIGWVAGSRAEYLSAGVMQFVDLYTLSDLHEAGATSLDLSGANMETIAAPKLRLGAYLVPYYTVEAYSLRRFAKWSLNWWQYYRHDSGA